MRIKKPSNYKKYLFENAQAKKPLDFSLKNEHEYFYKRGIYILGSTPARFNVAVDNFGRAIITDDLPSYLSLMFFPQYEMGNHSTDSERIAFYWSIANLSPRVVINRPTLDRPYIINIDIALDINFPKEPIFSGGFIYLNGVVEVDVCEMNIPYGYKSRLANKIKKKIGSYPLFFTGRWNLASCGNVGLTDLEPWCSGERIVKSPFFELMAY